MKLLFDTSVLVELDRRNPSALALMKFLTGTNIQCTISMITVSEILAGAHMQEDANTAALKAKELLAEFDWLPVSAETAEEVGKIIAKRKKARSPIHYQDHAIAATFFVENCDFLLTVDKKGFVEDFLKGKVYEQKIFHEKLKKRELMY